LGKTGLENSRKFEEKTVGFGSNLRKYCHPMIGMVLQQHSWEKNILWGRNIRLVSREITAD
jgi:hypothetical protein